MFLLENQSADVAVIHAAAAGDADEEDLEEVAANLREQRDKVCAWHSFH